MSRKQTIIVPTIAAAIWLLTLYFAIDNGVWIVNAATLANLTGAAWFLSAVMYNRARVRRIMSRLNDK
jgi:hypothetical protein